MSDRPEITQEQQAAKAFNKQSTVFDHIYSPNTIIQYKRGRVRDHIDRLIDGSSKILEINAGTGEDAIYFAKKGHSVHATDISDGMQTILKQKVLEYNLTSRVTTEICSFTQLATLKNKGPYDLLFSNFAGLNCTDHLENVLRSFTPLLKPHGIVTLVILPKFCLWETLFLFKGKFKTALRRFFSRRGRKAHIEGEYFLCWYYNPSFVKKYMRNEFEFIQQEGLCTLVPPSYVEHFAEKHPGLFRFLKRREDKWKARWPWKAIGDYYIISFRKL